MKVTSLKKILFAILCLCAVLMLHVTEAKAQEQEQQGIEYTIIKVKEPILMIPGDQRMISLTAPGNDTYESSNSKIVAVSNIGKIEAKKAGTAKITHINGTVKTIYTVKVKAQVDLIIFAGQSNMCGSGGNAAQAPTPDKGTAYEFDLTTNSKRVILMKEPFGEGTNRSNGLESSGKYSTNGTLVSAFCINYYKQTKTPVVGISCAWGGSSTNTWLKRGLVTKTQKAVKTAKKQLKKKKIKIRHIYMVWYQGESDAMQGVTEKTYISRMKKIYKKMKKVGVEKVFMIRIGHDMTSPEKDYTIMKAQEKLCSTSKNFVLVSKKAAKYRNSYPKYYSDTIHLNQKALNQVGYEAGKAAGKYVKKLKK